MGIELAAAEVAHLRQAAPALGKPDSVDVDVGAITFAPQIERAGASLVGISPQTVQQSFFMHDQHKLRFPLLNLHTNVLFWDRSIVVDLGMDVGKLTVRDRVTGTVDVSVAQPLSGVLVIGTLSSGFSSKLSWRSSVRAAGDVAPVTS